MSLVVVTFCSFTYILFKRYNGLLGQVYVNGSSLLEILLLSILPTAVVTGINTLVYLCGNYKQVLIIGISANIPCTILYTCPNFFGNTGAAMSNMICTIIGFAVSIDIAKKLECDTLVRSYIFILLISTAFVYMF